ncbi:MULTISPECIES: alpha/beta hydrolase [Halocynthiibacter]|uniref:Alpha/beta hydrolase n=1 Tax=Halocynthiibacter halioticoli TaxID=2986804 RepID=A0AAE3LSG1_9RHOB|nr:MULTISPECIES: alpha/beta hydrolase [Halocynthiibacter]MCV6823406.1 alpha/beta hydrolase [Halocynthiibacter halioticoli]MCW4056407.1 alpha/beta hydrolase [Halocynthiibacter sp. SDUM655004]
MDTSDAYANAKYIENAASYPPKWEAQAAAFREELSKAGRAEIGVRYGDHPRAQLDLFRPEREAKGLFVFVHGGYWRAFDRSTWSHFASGALAEGWAVAMPGYPLAPEVTISEITANIKVAIEKAATLIDGPIVLAGHSAGGHLVARMLCDDGVSEEVAKRITNVVPISPLSDLRPLMHADLNDDLHLTEAEAASESPILRNKAHPAPVTVWVGAEERPAFLDQARWLSEAWPDTVCEIEEGKHHFDVIDGLLDARHPLLRAILG